MTVLFELFQKLIEIAIAHKAQCILLSELGIKPSLNHKLIPAHARPATDTSNSPIGIGSEGSGGGANSSSTDTVPSGGGAAAAGASA